MQLSRTITASQAHASQCRTARNAAGTQPARLVIARSFQEGMFNDNFKQALQDALSRDTGASSDFSYARDNGSSYGYGGDSSYSRRSPAAAASEASPLLQILATALGQSRATLERLQAEEAEIENLIQKEQKQVERLEWLLEKVQQDYSYFNALQRRFDQESSGGSGGRW